ncbi:MAG: hypothetical protein HY957_10775 [Nitrospirae bacterium]|nr:hypothetical protein [Nitrospirota bacterium]
MMKNLNKKEPLSDNLITRVYYTVIGYIDRKDVTDALTIVAFHPETGERLYNEDAENSQYGRIVIVAERLNLVSELQRAPVAHHLWIDQFPLIVYLLLTCFDNLGQTDDWVDFNKWLTSNRKKDERDKVVNSLNPGVSAIEITKEIYSYYNKEYSVRTSFNNFIDNMLPTDIKKELLGSIRLIKKTELKNGEESTPEENQKFLFKLRNDFTHKGTSIRGFYHNLYDALPIYSRRNHWVTCPGTFGKYFNVSLKNWPFILEHAVKTGFSRDLENILKVNHCNEMPKQHIEVDVSAFLTFAVTTTWHIWYDEHQTVDSFIRDIAEGINSNGSQRGIRSAGYGLDWILYDINSSKFFDELRVEDETVQPKPTVVQAGFAPGMKLKVFDLVHTLNFQRSKVLFKKHEM